MRITENRYGKSGVRVARVVRHQDRHEMHEMTVAIQIEGDFDSSYSEGDNSKVLPTDTMKNTVYAFAAGPEAAQPESFALLLARHFVSTQPQVHRASVEVQCQPWQRNGRFSFSGSGPLRRTASVTAEGASETVEAGIADYLLLKTTGSAFAGFVKDSYTTLAETQDRLFATSLDARWRYRGEDISMDTNWWDTSWHAVMKLLTETFAEHESKSVQHTLYAMGEAVLAECDHVSRIHLTMPNKHYLPVDLRPFGLSNANEVFVPTDEPHGLIEAVLEQ
ncbi:MAG TPA: urate oxidase [Bryobacteraceae bacterium]|jgi:urate oxidase